MLPSPIAPRACMKRYVTRLILPAQADGSQRNWDAKLWRWRSLGAEFVSDFINTMCFVSYQLWWYSECGIR